MYLRELRHVHVLGSHLLHQVLGLWTGHGELGGIGDFTFYSDQEGLGRCMIQPIHISQLKFSFTYDVRADCLKPQPLVPLAPHKP